MASTRMKNGLTTDCFDISLRRAVKRDMTESPGLEQHQDAELRSADAYRLLQYGPEHRLQVARGGGYGAQHLRAPGLLLQRLGKLLPGLGELTLVFFELLFQIGAGPAHPTNARTWLRSVRTKLATARSALRLLARQGHLVGTVPGPFRSGPPAIDKGRQS